MKAHAELRGSEGRDEGPALWSSPVLPGSKGAGLSLSNPAAALSRIAPTRSEIPGDAPSQVDAPPATWVARLIARLRPGESSSPPRVAVVILPVCIVAAAVFGLAIAHGIDFLGGAALALLIAAVLAEAFPVPIE